MLTPDRIAVLRRIHNANIQKHALSPLTSQVTQIISDRGDKVTLEISNQTRSYPFPLGVINNKEWRKITKRKLTISRVTLQEALDRLRLNVLHVHDGYGLELHEAVVRRLRQHGLDVQRVGVVETDGDEYSELLTSATYHLKESSARVKLVTTDQEVAGAAYIDGLYHTRHYGVKLKLNTYELTNNSSAMNGRIHAGLIYWHPNCTEIVLKAKEDMQVSLINADLGEGALPVSYHDFRKLIARHPKADDTRLPQSISLQKNQEYRFSSPHPQLLLAVWTHDGLKESLSIEIKTVKE